MYGKPRRRDVVLDRLDEVRRNGADDIVAHILDFLGDLSQSISLAARWRTASRCRSDHSRIAPGLRRVPGGTRGRGTMLLHGLDRPGGLRAPIHR